MRRVALVTNGIWSTLHTGLELGRRLGEQGHDITFLSHADIGATVESHGFGFVHLTADRDAFDRLHDLLRVVRSGSAGDRFAALRRLPAALVGGRRSTVRADELIDAIRQIDPALLVIDIEEHLAIATTSQLGIPTALTTFLFAIEERPGVPPIDSWRTPEQTTDLAAEWERVRREKRQALRRRRRTIAPVVDRLGPVSYRTTSPAALRAVARKAGFDLVAETDSDQWLRPWGYRTLPVLSTNLRELEFGDGGGSNWHYVGPMVRVGRDDDAVAAGVDDGAWDAICRRRAVDDPHRPLVYCSLGSYWSADVRLLGKVVEVARRRPGWDVVIGLGGKGDPAALDPLPDNVDVLSWAPQALVLAQSDAAIVHGGNASLNECAVAGVPMVVCSTGHLDQNGIAARVDEFGLGVGVDGRRATADQIEAGLVRCLEDREFEPVVGRLCELSAGIDLRAQAVRILDRLVAAAEPVGAPSRTV